MMKAKQCREDGGRRSRKTISSYRREKNAGIGRDVQLVSRGGVWLREGRTGKASTGTCGRSRNLRLELVEEVSIALKLYWWVLSATTCTELAPSFVLGRPAACTEYLYCSL
jgi:hypothetical protein